MLNMNLVTMKGLVPESWSFKYMKSSYDMEGWHVRSKNYGKWTDWYKCEDPSYSSDASKITFSYPDGSKLQYRLFKRVNILLDALPKFQAPRGGITFNDKPN